MASDALIAADALLPDHTACVLAHVAHDSEVDAWISANHDELAEGTASVYLDRVYEYLANALQVLEDASRDALTVAVRNDQIAIATAFNINRQEIALGLATYKEQLQALRDHVDGQTDLLAEAQRQLDEQSAVQNENIERYYRPILDHMIALLADAEAALVAHEAYVPAPPVSSPPTPSVDPLQYVVDATAWANQKLSDWYGGGFASTPIAGSAFRACRYLPPGSTRWHPAADALAGTDEYGDVFDPTVAWSRPFCRGQ